MLLEHEINIYMHQILLLHLYTRKNLYTFRYATTYTIIAIIIVITSDFYLRDNKSFVRSLSETGFSQPTAEMIKELKKELNHDEIDLTKFIQF